MQKKILFEISKLQQAQKGKQSKFFRLEKQGLEKQGGRLLMFRNQPGNLASSPPSLVMSVAM